jgi:hypothetical protein
MHSLCLAGRFPLASTHLPVPSGNLSFSISYTLFNAADVRKKTDPAGIIPFRGHPYFRLFGVLKVTII